MADHSNRPPVHEPAAAAPDHQWQASGAGGGTAISKRRWPRVRILWLLAILVAASAFLLNELLLVKQRTPLIVIAPAPYEQPFLALPWSQENVAALNELDQETFTVADISDAWRTKSNGLRQLTTELQTVSRTSRRVNEVVLYFRTHAAVDGNGVPCLVLPDASASRSETWLPVADVFERIRSHQLSDSVKKLVIFDCSDVLVNWNQGVLFNTFAARLAAVSRAANIPNMIVISAASPGEIATSSPSLKQGVFAHFLRRGLGGEADLLSEMGNGDRQVSIRELLRYLKSHVQHGSQLLSGRSQRVMVIPEDPEDFDVSFALNSTIEKSMTAKREIASPKSAAVSPREISELWMKFQRFHEMEAIRFEPKLWIDLAHRMIALESAAESGGAYDKSARRLHAELLGFMAALDSRTTPTGGSSALPVLWEKVAFERPFPNNVSMQFHSTRMSELFATLPAPAVERIRTLLTKFKENPTVGNLDETVKSMSLIEGGQGLDDFCFCQLLQRYRVLERWNNPSLIASMIDLRELADLASVPNDERVLEWIRQEVDRADVHRRNAEDQMFVGSGDPSLNVSKARVHYQNAIEIARRTKVAFGMRSQIAYEIPYLAKWATGPSFAVDSEILPSAALQPILRQLIRNQISLEQTLSSPSIVTLGDTVALPFDGIVAKLAEDRDQILRKLDDEYERFIQMEIDTADAVAISDMNGLLSVPLLPRRNDQLGLGPAEQRIELREKTSRLHSRLFEQFRTTPDAMLNSMTPPGENPGGQESDSLEDSEIRRTNQYLEGLLVGIPEHIAVSILANNLGDETADPGRRDDRDLWATADKQGNRFRESLVGVQNTVMNDIEEQMTSTVLDTVLRRTLGGWCIRVMAASDALPEFDDDPIAWRRRQDLVRFLIWHAQRALDDFWGGSVADGVPLFEKSVTDTLRAAESIGIPMTDSRLRLDAIRTLLGRRMTAARRGLKTRADDLLLVEDDEPASIKVEVVRNPQDDVSLPDGTAVVFLRDGHGKSVSEYRQLPLTPPDAPGPAVPPVQLEVPFLGQASSGVKAVTMFRGNEFISELPINLTGGVLIDYSPSAGDKTSIAVRGRTRRKMSILFVLDCSASMQTELPLETNRGSAPRLEIAKLAVQQMFEKLAEEDANRVGVMLFGHRLGWNLKQAGDLLKQTSYSGTIPDRIRPYDDVETILPLGRFNPSFAASIHEQLATVRPWGESPLYLALIQALRQFQSEDADTEKAIVVITDGMNYQFNAPPAARKTVNDVVTAWSEVPVPIHIVGLGIAADQSQEAQRVFGDLAQKSGGSYVPAQEAQTLIAKLDSLRRPKTFKVTTPDGAEKTSELSQPVFVAPQSISGNEFSVSFGNSKESVLLRGGEAIDLVPSRDERSFETGGYGNGQTQFVTLIDGDTGKPTEFAVGLHRPIRRGNIVRFEFSIQNALRRFVPRPADVWIEVAPVVPASSAAVESYVFYDSNYAPGTSVPVLKWQADQWPASANQARIRFWCKMTETPPTRIIALDGTPMPDRSARFGLAEAPGISYGLSVRRGDPCQALLIERHSVDSPGIAAMKVEFRSDAIVPARVTHRFDSANRWATHRFQFRPFSRDVGKLGEIRLTSRQALMQGAWSLPESILVDVTEATDVLEPRPEK